MKKRAKRKKIPYGPYCYGGIGRMKYCPFRRSYEDPSAVDGWAHQCTYLGIVDKERDTLLWDSVKECEEHNGD